MVVQIESPRSPVARSDFDLDGFSNLESFPHDTHKFKSVPSADGWLPGSVLIIDSNTIFGIVPYFLQGEVGIYYRPFN